MSALSITAWEVFFKGLYCKIPWALSCSNYGNWENETVTAV